MFNNEELKTLAPKNSLASQAIEALEKHKKPHRKLEDWRYTRFSDFNLVDHEVAASPYPLAFEDYRPSLIYNNMDFSKKDLPKGLSLKNLTDKTFFNKINSSYNDTNYMSLFGIGLSPEVSDLHITESLPSPLNIVSLSAPKNKQAGLHAKTMAIRLDDKTKANINFFNFSFENSKSYENLWIELEEGAELDLSFLQEHFDSEYFGKTIIHCKTSSKLNLSCLDTAAKKQKQEVHIYLHGKNIEVSANGAYCLNNQDHVENYIRIHHLTEGSQSKQLFKGILDEKSRGIFDGRIFVAKGADQTQADQLCKNLLLSSAAEMNTKPQLEIYADDVKCSHGATISRFLEEQIFYFQARGIRKEKAVDLLAKGFLLDAVARVKDSWLKNIFEKHLAKKIKKIRVKYDS